MRTPGPYADESPRAYVVRLSEENGYDCPAVLHELLEGSCQYRITVGWSFDKLQAVLGPLQILPKSFGYQAAKKRAREGASLLGQEVHPKHLGLRKARICPTCVKEIGYVPAAWDLKAFIACPIHGRMMLKYCSTCNRRIQYNRPGLLTCSCGADLSAGEMDFAPPHLVALMEILLTKVSGNRECLQSAYTCGIPVEELLACELSVLCKVIVTLATLLAWQASGVRTPQKLSDVARFVPEAARVLSHWPLNFHKFCGKWHANPVSRQASRSFQVHFSWLFVRLYKNLKVKKRQTLFLIQAALSYGMRNWSVSPVSVKGVEAKLLMLPPPRYGSYADASRVLGVPLYTVQRWLASKKIPSRSSMQEGKRPLWVVDIEELSKLKVSSSPSIGSREAARHIGVSYGVYKALRKSGLLINTYLIDFDSGMSIEDLESFKDSVLLKANKCTSVKGKHSLASILDASFPIAKKVDLIRMIIDGEIEAFWRGSKRVRNMYVEVDFVNEHRENVRNSKVLGIYAAAGRYGLSYRETRAIIFLHSLRGVPARKNGMGPVVPGQIESFLKKHVPLRCIAREEGVPRNTLRKKLVQKASKVLVRLNARCRLSKFPGDDMVLFVRRRSERRVRAIARAIGNKAA